MIYVKNTPNNTGVAIYGDHLDFEELYEALHAIVGDEDEYSSYEAARIRVLGVCYDLRHALMGNREFEFVDNGMDRDKMRFRQIIAPEKNVYLVINVLWPEMLFITMALNNFIVLNYKKCKHPQWDKTTAAVRKFQAAVAECLGQMVSEASFKRLLKVMLSDYNSFSYYITQYVDLLNCRFLDMTKEKRQKNLSTIAKRIAELGPEYEKVRHEVWEAAREYGCSAENIRLAIEYPEHIEW